MAELKNPYIKIIHGSETSYGGNQLWSDSKAIRDCGCGIVAAADMLIYLSALSAKYRLPSPVEPNYNGNICAEEYKRFLARLRARYFPIIPPFGMNAIVHAAGLQRCFHAYSLPVSASLCASGDKLWNRAKEMLINDFPVILAIGPNFPCVWKENRLKLYSRRPDGTYFVAAKTKAHFVTMTSIDGEWCRISSWGRELYINISEFKEYVSKYSSSIVCNIIMIKDRSGEGQL